MSSPNRTSNDMYEDTREGTSGTRNEGNNYNILLHISKTFSYNNI